MGPKDYGVLLTDQRAIFVLEKVSRAAVLGSLGDMLLNDDRQVDYQNENLDQLAADTKNVVVPYVGIQKLHLKKGFSSYTMSNAFTLLIDYTDNANKSRSVKAFLVPPDDLIAKRKSEGVDRKAATEEYARNARKAIEQAMPPGALQRGEWDI
jgi:hypothetical protein